MVMSRGCTVSGLVGEVKVLWDLVVGFKVVLLYVG